MIRALKWMVVGPGSAGARRRKACRWPSSTEPRAAGVRRRQHYMAGWQRLRGSIRPRSGHFMILKLAQTRFGRVLFHFVCCLLKPKHLGWHWRGIVREFPFAR